MFEVIHCVGWAGARQVVGGSVPRSPGWQDGGDDRTWWHSEFAQGTNSSSLEAASAPVMGWQGPQSWQPQGEAVLLPTCSEVCWGSAESQMSEQAGPAGHGRLATVPWEKANVVWPLGGLGGKLHCWEPQAFSWNELPSLDSAFPILDPSGTLLDPSPDLL